MSTAAQYDQRPLHFGEHTLANGDHMRQPEFHRCYLAYPEDSKFELIAGTVFMASPLGWAHARFHTLMAWLLETYATDTPGIEPLDNITTILDEENEPQPDLALRVLTEYGGKSVISDESYLQGPPELVVEIAHSTRAIDLHQKKTAYRKNGVKEYLVFSVKEKSAFWFDFNARRSLDADKDGICKSSIFPGLWLSVPGLANRDKRSMLAALRTGLKSLEHEAFAKRLEARQNRRK